MNAEIPNARPKLSFFDFRRFDFFNISSSTKADLLQLQPNKFTQEGRQASRKAYIPLGLYNSSCPLLIRCRTNRHGGGNTRGRYKGERGDRYCDPPGARVTYARRQLKCIPYLILYRKLFRKFRNLFVCRSPSYPSL